MPRKQIILVFNILTNHLFNFVQNISKLVSENFGYIKCIPYFKKGRNLLSYFSSKIKEFETDSSTGVYRIPCDD